MHWRKVDKIPPKGRQGRTRQRDPLPRTRDTMLSGYGSLLEEFQRGGYDLKEFVYDTDTYDPNRIVSSLRSALRAGGEDYDDLEIVRRGDRVFVRRVVETSRRLIRREVAEILTSFDLGSSGVAQLDLPYEFDPVRIYHALHYKRTRLGLGHITIAMKDGHITLSKKGMSADD